MTRRDSATRTTKLWNLSSRVPPPRPITLSPVLSSSHWAGLGKKFRRAERKYFLRKSTEHGLSPERGFRRSSATRTSCWPHTKCMVIPVKLCITCMERKDQKIPINILARLKNRRIYCNERKWPKSTTQFTWETPWNKVVKIPHTKNPIYMGESGGASLVLVEDWSLSRNLFYWIP